MPKIYTPSTHKTGLAVYQSDDLELTFLVEVKRRPQSSMMTIVTDDKDLKRNHHSAEEAFDELSSILGAELVVIPQKYIIKEFDFYKKEVDTRREERKRIRDEKKNQADEEGIVPKVSLFDGKNQFLKY